MTEQHPFIRLAQALPWEDLLATVLRDLQCIEKRRWWVDRPLRVWVH